MKVKCLECNDIITAPEDGSMTWCSCGSTGLSYANGVKTVSGRNNYEDVE